MTDLDFEFVREALSHLHRRDWRPQTPAALSHRYEPGPRLYESTVETIERRYGFTTPADYRRYLLCVGDGGAGPNWGLLPFGAWPGGGNDFVSWGDVFNAWSPAREFSLTSPWNEPASFFDQEPDYDSLPEAEHESAERAWDALFTAYCREELLNGAIPLSEVGCGIFEWLVVTGVEAGNVWVDSRSDSKGIFPRADADGSRMTFGSWYMSWLGECLRACPLPSKKPGLIHRLFGRA